ncbi:MULTISPECIES: peptidoglycan-binding protein LysM [unclassified Caballeronia]|uniref:peptidoglycan-binding protein LysM n=1 Tax=unclassified Caballeronia TaxID=2646786 RepID=UPI001FD3420B|nr:MULTISPECIES: peptidoglycan-binding protein LysM [unclassified Caballeronia]MDR5771375.1 peptidoglycan-binding protein LysM [Caballeronia sp. LZ002]MDR5846811.1 peptidoglycan-binding protein LysM [Caballeronia sp. LZ003]
MGILSFIKEAGEKLFGATSQTAQAAPAAVDVAELNLKAGEAIATYIRSQGLEAQDLQVKYDGASHTVTVSGEAADQATKEKILVAAGNVQHVDKVDDQLTVPSSAPESQFHTVVAGDNLWKIAEKYYGSGAKNDVIFEANKPMLKSPDKIYPGQVLRIPAAS